MRNLTKYRLTWLYNQWTLKREGSIHLTEVFRGQTKENATEASARLLEGTGSSLYIHHENGQLDEKRLYPQPVACKKTFRKSLPPNTGTAST